MLKRFRWICLCLVVAPLSVAAQPFDFPAAAAENEAALSQRMPGLAREVIAVYKDDDRRRFLDNLFRLQSVAGQSTEAAASLATLRSLGPDNGSPQADATRILYEIFTTAKARKSPEGSFDEAFRRSFREVLGKQGDTTAALVIRALSVDLTAVQQNLKDAIEPQKRKSTIALAEAGADPRRPSRAGLPRHRAARRGVEHRVVPLAPSSVGEMVLCLG